MHFALDSVGLAKDVETLYRDDLTEDSGDGWFIEVQTLEVLDKAALGLAHEKETRIMDDGIVLLSANVCGYFDIVKGEGVVQLKTSALPNAFGEMFRLLYNYHAALRFEVLMHAAAVVKDGRAYLFAGHSQSGKSTASRLSLAQSGAQKLLHDDTIRLIRDEKTEQTRILAPPYFGVERFAYADKTRYPVARIFLVEKANRPALKPVKDSLALTKLATFPFLQVRHETSEEVLRYAELVLSMTKSLVERAQCFIMAFEKERLPDNLWE